MLGLMQALRPLAVCWLLAASLAVDADQAPQARPLNQSELAAMLAGGVTGKNLTAIVQMRGINFKPQQGDIEMLRDVGASAAAITAVRSAKVSLGSGRPADPAVTQAAVKAARLMRDRQFTQAAQQIADALRSDPQADELAFVMGKLLTEQNEWPHALAIYSELAQRDPAFPEIHTKLALVYHKLNEPDDALQQAKWALEQTPKNAEAHRMMGLAYGDKGLQDAAIAEYEEALKLEPGLDITYFDLGLANYLKHDYEQAIAMFQKAILIAPTDSNYHFSLAVTLQAKKDYLLAIQQYRLAIQYDPNNLKARDNLASLWRRLGKLDEAEAAERETLKIAPDSLLAHDGLGFTLLEKQKLTEAAEEFQLILRSDPGFSDAHCGLGIVYYKQKKIEAAIAELKTGQDQECEEGTYWLGKIYLEEQKDPVRAAAQFERAIQMAPDDWRAHYELGLAREANGDAPSALNQYREAMKLVPENKYPRKALAELLEKQGDYASALQQYVEMLKLRLATEEDVSAVSQRARKHIEELRKGGKKAEADELEGRLQSVEHKSSEDPLVAWDAALKRANDAVGKQDYAGAEAAWREALQQAQRMQPQNEHLVTSYARLGKTLMYQRKFDEAEAVLRRGLEVSDQMFGATSNSFELLGTLADVCRARHDFACTEEFLERRVQATERSAPGSSLNRGAVLALAEAYYWHGDYDKAQPLYMQLTEMDAGEKGSIVAQEFVTLGKIYESKGQNKEAETYYRKGLAMIEKADGLSSPGVLGAIEPLMALLIKEGRNEEAAPLAARRQALRDQLDAPKPPATQPAPPAATPPAKPAPGS